MQNMPEEMESTYAGRAYKAVYIKYYRALNDGALSTDIVDICEFMLLHDKMSRRENVVDEETAKTDEELHYVNLRNTLKKLINMKNEYLNVLEQLTEVSDYNNCEEVNRIVVDILKK